MPFLKFLTKEEFLKIYPLPYACNEPENIRPIVITNAWQELQELTKKNDEELLKNMRFSQLSISVVKRKV